MYRMGAVPALGDMMMHALRYAFRSVGEASFAIVLAT